MFWLLFLFFKMAYLPFYRSTVDTQHSTRFRGTTQRFDKSVCYPLLTSVATAGRHTALLQDHCLSSLCCNFHPSDLLTPELGGCASLSLSPVWAFPLVTSSLFSVDVGLFLLFSVCATGFWISPTPDTMCMVFVLLGLTRVAQCTTIQVHPRCHRWQGLYLFHG